MAEAIDEVGVGAVLGAQHLDGDVALELVVAGPVDGRHAALPEQLDQPVPSAEDGADVRQVASLNTAGIVPYDALAPGRAFVTGQPPPGRTEVATPRD